MAVIKTIEKGESLTFGFVLPDTYNLANLQSVKVYIGSTVYAHTMVSRTIRVELTSNATALLTGRNIVHFVIDDAVFGIKKINCGELEVLPTQATHKDESINTGYDVEIVLSIDVETISITSILYDVLKGKTAYESAQDGGYTGTEEQFNADLANVRNKVDKETDKSLVEDTEIEKLSEYPELTGIASDGFVNAAGELEQIAAAVGGFANNLYFSNAASDVAGCKKLTYDLPPEETVISQAVSSGDGEVLVASHLYADTVSADIFPAGLWSFEFYGRVSSTVGTTQIGARYFRYTSANEKVYLFPAIAWSNAITNTVNNWIPIVVQQPSFAVQAGDRMGCDIFVKSTSMVARTVYYILGDGYASYLNNPNAVRHRILRAKNEELAYQHLDTTTTKTTPIDADSVGLWDSVAAKFVRTTLANLKTFLSNTFFSKSNIVSELGVDTAKVINQKKHSNELLKKSNSLWIDSFGGNYTDSLIPMIDLTSKAIKDIWFDFPSGTTPTWFNQRTPILRSITNNNRFVASTYPIRIYFYASGETSFNETYAIDAPLVQITAKGDMLYRITKTIDGSVTVANILINWDELIASFVPSSGILFTSAEGLEMKLYIKKKTTQSILTIDESSKYYGGVKTILNDNGTYIEYNSTTFKLTIPANSRVINYRGDVINITSGQYDVISTLGGGGYFNLFVDAINGTVIPIYVQDLQVQSQWKLWDENRYFWIGWVHGSLKKGYINASSYKIDEIIYGSEQNLSEVFPVVPQIKNNQIKEKQISESLKLVFFGSSWGQNTWWYLNKIIQSAGINAELTCFFTGGAYFEQWNDRWDDDTNIDCWQSTNGSDWIQTSLPFKTTISSGVDIIAFQQGAFQAINWDSYWKNEWSSLVRKIKISCGINTVIVFNSTWTPGVNGGAYNLLPYPNTVDGQMSWQTDNYNNTKRFIAHSGIDIVSPAGALIWALRRNPLINNSVDLATDNMHLDNGLPMYSIAGMLYESIIAPLYGVSFNDITWMPDASTPKAPVSGNAWQDISIEQRDIIRQCIKLALGDRFGFNQLQ